MLHQIKITDLNTFESKQQIAGVFGNGKNKSLNIISKVLKSGKIYSYYSVEVSRVERLQTQFLGEAIFEYNKY